MSHPPFRAASLGLAALLLAACGAKEGAAPAAAQPRMPPPEVGVVTAALASAGLQTELPGRVEPQRIAQVRARVTGIVLERAFREGSEVRAGQKLYQIDAAPYKAALDSALAAQARAQANLVQATAQAARLKPLAEANAVSQQELVNAVAAQQQAEADVAAARAAITTARIALDYTTVSAPIAGRIGRALVTEGALVSQTEGTPLAVIQQTSSVYVNITQSVADVLRLRKAVAAGRQRDAGAAVPVRIVLDDGSELPRPGRLLFSDLSVDATTGQITLRAEVPNGDGTLLPGQYVRARLVQSSLPEAILLPQQAVTRGDKGDTVIVVGEGGVTAVRPVQVGPAEGRQWVVLQGLKAGEQVMVDGFQKLRAPGMPVKPVPWQPGGGAPAAAASAAVAASAASGAAPAAASPASGRN